MRSRITPVGLILKPRLENFIYPGHIDRASIDALPSAPGVYFFRNEQGEPIYIGKSVNIRTRVLSHMRTPEEQAMLNESCSVDFIRTGGEIGALLLESKLIKEMQPHYNILLRYVAEAFGLQLRREEDFPRIVGSSEVDFPSDDVFGFFPSRYAAETGLRALARKYGLCLALLGLESRIKGRACFSHQLGGCRGACVGKDPLHEHTARLRQGLAEVQALVWPFEGRIGIIEEHDGLRETHVIDRWAYLGSLRGRRKKLPSTPKHVFDVDTYMILARPMLLGELEVVHM